MGRKKVLTKKAKCHQQTSASSVTNRCPRAAPEAFVRNALRRSRWAANQQPRQPTPPDPASPRPQFPQLEIIELIEMGGMGVVYKPGKPARSLVAT